MASENGTAPTVAELTLAVAIEHEQMVLSAALSGGIGAVTEILAPADFFETRHAKIYHHLVELHYNGLPTTSAAVLGRAVDAQDRSVTPGYLVDLRLLDAKPEQIRFYARRVADEAHRRKQAEDVARLSRAMTIPDPAACDAEIARILAEIEARTNLAEQLRTVGHAGPQYGDVAALLDGGIPPPPQPEILHRVDTHALLYRGKVNILYGDSESGKTWIALAALVEVLNTGGKAAVVDLDHNGMSETITRLIQLGAKPADLSDSDRFRYCEPADAEDLDYFITDLAQWQPWAATVDSLGEVLPMLGFSSSSPDDYTNAHRRVLTPLADAGAAVIAIDHLPKDDDARTKGQTGTTAKKRAVNGSTLRVTVTEQFTPGHGGAANLSITKDRPGGLREHCPAGKNAPAGRFILTDPGDGTLSWHITTPAQPGGTKTSGPRVSDEALAAVLGMNPEDRTRRKVQDHLKCGSDKAQAVLFRLRELGEQGDDD